MDKSLIEILAEVIGCSPDFVQRYSKDKTINVPIPAVLEAMKIAMKQAFEAGEKRGYDDCRISGHPDVDPEPYGDFDEWFNKLEEQK